MERSGRIVRGWRCLSNTKAERRLDWPFDQTHLFFAGEKLLKPGSVPIGFHTGVQSENRGGSAARMGKDRKRSDNENYRNDDSAIAIKFLRSRGLPFVIKNCRDQDFDQRKENEQGTDEEENIESRHVRQARSFKGFRDRGKSRRFAADRVQNKTAGEHPAV